MRRLVSLLPVPAAAAVTYGAWEIYQPAGYITAAAALLFLEWRYDRDDDGTQR